MAAFDIVGSALKQPWKGFILSSPYICNILLISMEYKLGTLPVLDIVTRICIGYRIVSYPSTYKTCKPRLGRFQPNITRTRWLQRANRFRHTILYGIRAGPLRDLAAAAVYHRRPPRAAAACRSTTKKKITTPAAAVLSGPPSQLQLPSSTLARR
jgi:hypothetical protein